jgi:hypothetical protein
VGEAFIQNGGGRALLLPSCFEIFNVLNDSDYSEETAKRYRVTEQRNTSSVEHIYDLAQRRAFMRASHEIAMRCGDAR